MFSAIALVVVLVLGSYHIGVSFLRAPSPTTVSTRMQFNEKNREDFTNLRTKYEEEKELRQKESTISPVALTARNDDKQYLDEEVDLLFDIGFSVLDMIEEVYEDIIMQYFVDSLNQEQENELISILSSVNENIDKNESTENLDIMPRGWHTTNVVIAMSYGYVGGAIASYLIGWATGYAFAMFGSSMGIVGTIVSGVLGYIVGSWVESKYLDRKQRCYIGF